MRKDNVALFVHGSFDIIDYDNKETFTFTKTWNARQALVVTNFTDDEQKFVVPKELQGKSLQLLLSNVDEVGDDLTPWEARAYLVD